MLEEERRLLYVGITRAKERLYLTHAFRRSRFGGTEPSEPSSFLTAIPASTLAAGSRSHEPTRPATRSCSLLSPPQRGLYPGIGGAARIHAKFGDGIVVQVADRNEDQEITVQFKRHGEKRLMGSLANSRSTRNKGGSRWHSGYRGLTRATDQQGPPWWQGRKPCRNDQPRPAGSSRIHDYDRRLPRLSSVGRNIP